MTQVLTAPPKRKRSLIGSLRAKAKPAPPTLPAPKRPLIGSLTAKAFSDYAVNCYRHGPRSLRWLARLRPYCCPFEILLKWIPRDASVLDIGCGNGLFLALAAGSGVCGSGVGFDVAQDRIDCAREMARQLAQVDPSLDLRFSVVVPGEAWPTGEFDVVSIIDVMHHMPPAHQESFLEQAAAKLRPSGLLLYKDICRRPLWRALANRLHDMLVAREWINYAPIARVEKWARSCGLVCVHRENRNRLWYGHELRVFQKPSTS